MLFRLHESKTYCIKRQKVSKLTYLEYVRNTIYDFFGFLIKLEWLAWYGPFSKIPYIILSLFRLVDYHNDIDDSSGWYSGIINTTITAHRFVM